MKTRNDILKIEVLPSQELAVYPSNPDGSFQYIYRAACGVDWDNENKRFFAKRDGYNASELSLLQWYDLIISATYHEMGLDLKITNHTQWVNVSEDQKNKLMTHKVLS